MEELDYIYLDKPKKMYEIIGDTLTQYNRATENIVSKILEIHLIYLNKNDMCYLFVHKDWYM